MKKNIYILFIAMLAFNLTAFCGASGDFAKHSAGFHVTPSADYLLYRPGSNPYLLVESPYEGLYPFIGFSFGAEYIYRPVEIFGVSTGLQVDMQGLFVRTYAHYAGKRYVSAKTNIHDLNISLPIYFHLYKKMTACTFEFATGPEFNFNVLERWATTSYTFAGEKITSSHGKEKLTSRETRETAGLGWSIFLGGVRTISDNVDLFIGPQIQYQNIAYFKKDSNKAAKEGGRYYPVSLGVKLGFRFHN